MEQSSEASLGSSPFFPVGFPHPLGFPPSLPILLHRGEPGQQSFQRPSLQVRNDRSEEKSLGYFKEERRDHSFVHRSSQNYFLLPSFFYEIHRLPLYPSISLSPAAWHRTGLPLPTAALCLSPALQASPL